MFIENMLLNGVTALPFPQFALLHTVTCVQFWLLTILGNCGCVAVANFLGVPSPLLSFITCMCFPMRVILSETCMGKAGSLSLAKEPVKWKLLSFKSVFLM
jgi:hypothetical protein